LIIPQSGFHELIDGKSLYLGIQMTELTDKQIQKFLRELMEIQRRYANEQKNQKSNRQSEVREMLEKFVVTEDKDED
jgi:hypothetical protein